VADLNRLAARERLQFFRQFLGAWHGCRAHQNGYHPYAALQRDASLQADEVIGIVEPPVPGAIGSGSPLVTDDDDQHAARSHGVFDCLDEINAGLDTLDVHEHTLRAEV